MINTITVTNFRGDKLVMPLAEPEKSGFAIVSIDGLGPSKGNVNTSEISSMDGSAYNSARINERNIVMSLLYQPTGDIMPEDLRHKSYVYFPVKHQVTIQIDTDRRSVQTVGYVESNEQQIWSKDTGCQISIICPDPFFYSSEKQITLFYGVDPAFEFPFSNESLDSPLLEFSTINPLTENVIPYKGDADTGVTIYIHVLDDVTNVSLKNLTTNETMTILTDKLQSITGNTKLLAFDDIIVDTHIGRKSITLIRDGATYNILNCIGKDAQWMTLVVGDNLFSFDSDMGISKLQFRIENSVLYEGV